MAEYRNIQAPEEINYSQQHPLREFAWLVAALGLGFVLVLVGLVILVRGAVLFVPFQVEVEFFGNAEAWVRSMANEPTWVQQSERHQELTEYLNLLAEDLMGDEYAEVAPYLFVHYVDSPVRNAYASLGGHVYIHQGILDQFDSENALSMVLAHEIAHIVHRDPLKSLGTAATATLVGALFTGSFDNAAAKRLFESSGTLGYLSFSRDQERDADQEALRMVSKHYGHTFGAEVFFAKSLEEYPRDGDIPEFLKTHPDLQDRLKRIRQTQRGEGHREPLLPLPEFVRER